MAVAECLGGLLFWDTVYNKTDIVEKRGCSLQVAYIKNERVPKITLNDTTVSECCLIKLFPYILFEKYHTIPYHIR